MAIILRWRIPIHTLFYGFLISELGNMETYIDQRTDE